MPLYRRCGRCGKRIQSGSRCTCLKERYKEYDRFSRDKKSYDYYHSDEWERSRQQALDLDGGIDVYLYMTRGEIVIADTAHHIVPLKDDWSRRADISNLISLNHDTHSMIEQIYKTNKRAMQEELARLLYAYRNECKGEGRSEKF